MFGGLFWVSMPGMFLFPDLIFRFSIVHHHLHFDGHSLSFVTKISFEITFLKIGYIVMMFWYKRPGS